MNLLFKLIYREAWYHRSRIALAAIATSAMSAMLVWLIGSIELMVMQYENDGEHYLGHYSAAVTPPSSGRNPFAPPADASPLPPAEKTDMQKVAEALKADPLVLEAAAARQIRNTMAKWKDEYSVLQRMRSGLGMPMGSPVIIGIDAKECPFELANGRWFNLPVSDSQFAESAPETKNGTETELEGVIGTGAAKSLSGWGHERDPVKTGDYVGVRIGEKEYKIKITGTVEQKLGGSFGGPMEGGITPAVGALYVSMNTADILSPVLSSGNGTNSPPAPLYYYVRLKDGVNVKKWIEQFRLSNETLSNETLTFITADDIQASLSRQRGRDAGGLVGAAASKNAVILFAAIVSILIVFSALSMGVSERSRTFAMLRTAGMPRRGIVFLIFGEGFILSISGWLGGILAGWIILQASAAAMNGTMKLVPLNTAALLVSGIAAVAGAMLAAIIPARRGASIQPLEGMNRGAFALTERLRFGIMTAAAVSIILLSVNPFICYYEPLTQTGSTRQIYYSFIGLPAQLFGLLFLVPAVILFVEKLFTPLTAKLLFVPKELLKNQLSANLWRTTGTAVALSIGLGVYSFLEISGYSMLVPFTHTDKLPDTLAAFIPKGLPLPEIDKVKELPGVDKERFLPIALEQPLFSDKQKETFLKNEMSEMQAGAGIVVFGLDIAEAFEGAFEDGKPMVDLTFTEGTLKEALAKLKSGGRYCIIPDSFAFRAKLHISDKVELLPHIERAGGKPPRQQVQQQQTQQQSQQKAQEPFEYEVCGVVSIPGWLWMAKLSGIRKYGYRSGAMMFAPYNTVQKDFKINDAAYFWFDRTGNVSDEELESNLQKLTDETIGSETFRPMVKISSHNYLNEQVGSRADQVIQAAARMPLILLAVSSFAMTGTIAASIRVRRFEFGVLRSLGITRSGLVRLILAEALLISIAAVVLSTAFGILGGWCFIGLMKYVSFFGGFTSPLTIPVYYLSIGIGAAVILCSIAAILPAIAAGRKECTELLKQ